MAAATSRRTAKKRKISADLPSSTVAQTKKKSILFNKPQNFYAPPESSSMTKEELTAWRKEERKKRNRESAAASRNKIKGRITELESELSEWKSKYADMEEKMRDMEQHIQLLTQLNGNSSTQGQAVPLPPSAISHPNSPQISPVPSIVTSFAASSSHTIPNVPNLFPNLLSEPQNSAKVETQQAASPDDDVATVVSKNDIKS
eukprot:65449_1